MQKSGGDTHLGVSQATMHSIPATPDSSGRLLTGSLALGLVVEIHSCPPLQPPLAHPERFLSHPKHFLPGQSNAVLAILTVDEGVRGTPP
jgi:hypothetical protein